MKNLKGIKNILIIVLILALLVFGFRSLNKFKIERKVETLTEKIEENIVGLSELVSVKYNYTNIVEYDNSLNISGISIPFTNKTFLVKYSGYIKAGSDLSKAELDLVSPKHVKLKIEEPRILENVIPEEEVYFFNEKESVFNSLKFDDLYNILKEEKIKVEKEVIDNGILEDSRQNIESGVVSFMQSLGFEKIDIDFY